MTEGIPFDKTTPIEAGTLIGVYGYPGKIKGKSNYTLWG